ncbi:zinc-dependent alcohol dehydrogenase family protein [Brevundimonas vesicularis]|uniref:zinc-dependent alcohol dehydrogenase family protein n=1 Tax=Brevundimonas vesicularis TaxID=41276 RepID=UPI0038D47F35
MIGNAYRIDIARGLHGLRKTSEPDPTPGPGQILIAIRAASLNYRDILVAEGRYGRMTSGDLVPLSDGSGDVVAVGEGVTRFKIGDRVMPGFSSTWVAGSPTPQDLAATLGSPLVDGVLRRLFVCNADKAVAVPASLSHEEAACLPCAGVTAWNALYGHRPVRAGDTVLTLGLGGVSCFAIQLAKAAGARVISTSSSDQKLKIAKVLGAADLINYSDRPDWDRAVLDLTHGRGVDHVIEVGGGGTLEQSIASTAVNGHIHMIGVLTDGQVNPRSLIAWRTLRGVTVGSSADLAALCRMVEANSLKPMIDKVFDFDDAPAAYQHLREAGHVGKVVVRIS